MNFLEEIIALKKKELSGKTGRITMGKLKESKYFGQKGIPLTESILDPDKTGIIAEFKRKSPSSGIINHSSDIQDVTVGYVKHGASGLSILTDYKYFGGKNSDLSLARKLNDTPVLRKDFIIDEYQVIESKIIGASAILLIAAALKKNTTLLLARLARSIGLQVLLEVHNAEEIDFLNEYIDIIGVNNRDLRTFDADISVSLKLADKIPQGIVRISESGISSPADVLKLRSAGYQGFLIGGLFMSTVDPVATFTEFANNLKENYD